MKSSANSGAVTAMTPSSRSAIDAQRAALGVATAAVSQMPPTSRSAKTKAAYLKTEERKTAVPIAKQYEPTPPEREILKSYFARDQRKSAPHLKVKETARGVPKIELGLPDQAVGQLLLMNAIGTAEIAFYDRLIKQIANAGTQIIRRSEKMHAMLPICFPIPILGSGRGSDFS
jgi:hypothetical protein